MPTDALALALSQGPNRTRRNASPMRGGGNSGDHVILIYEDGAELFTFVIPFIKDGLAKGERCILVVESESAEVVEALSDRAVAINREVKRGAFAVTTAREFFGFPPFNAARAMARILRAQREAASAGFAGLRLAGDWAWSLGKGDQNDELRELESLVERAVGPGRLTVACMYRRDRIDPDTLERLVRLHTKVIASDYVFLRMSALFRSLAPQDLQGLARSARERVRRKGAFFFQQGAPARDVYLLTSGLVKLVRTTPGGEGVILRVVAPVQHFGDGRIGLGDAVRFASAEALEDSRALVWDSSAIAEVVLAHPAVGVSVIRWLQELMEEERTRLEDFLSADAKRRLARLFLRLGHSLGHKTRRGVVIDVTLSGRDLAELVVTSPYTVSRILAEWRRLRILDAQRTRIHIQDREQLTAIAEQPVSEPDVTSRIS